MNSDDNEMGRLLRLWTGGILLFTAGLAGYAVKRGLRSLKRYSRPFDAGRIEEMEGILLEVFHPKESSYDTRGVVLILDVEDEIVEAHLGPAWYVNRQIRSFKNGEKLSLRGSSVNYRGDEILVVQTLHMGRKEYRFRDDHGSPFWESRVR